MENNLSVLVLYDLKDIKPYICLSNFLRLCGIEVEPKRLGYDELQMDVNEMGRYACAISLSGTVEMYRGYATFLNVSSNAKASTDDQSVCERIVLNTLEEMQEHRIFSDEKLKTMYRIAEVYGQEAIRIHEFNFQQYFYDEESMRGACEGYKKAEDFLFAEYRKLKTEGKEEEARLVQYARCFCAVRVVLIERRYGFAETYDISLIKRALQVLFDEDDSMVMIYWLLAQLCEAEEKRTEALGYYSQYIEISNRRIGSFTSDILYRQGKILEEKGNKKGAFQYYAKAQECNKGNYRATYKMIDYAEYIERNYALAIKEYQDLIYKFENIKKVGCLQPMELEYLFKLYFRCGRLYADGVPDKEKALEYFEKAEKITQITVESMRFMADFYGNKVHDYLKKIGGRFPKYQTLITNME